MEGGGHGLVAFRMLLAASAAAGLAAGGAVPSLAPSCAAGARPWPWCRALVVPCQGPRPSPPAPSLPPRAPNLTYSPLLPPRLDASPRSSRLVTARLEPRAEAGRCAGPVVLGWAGCCPVYPEALRYLGKTKAGRLDAARLCCVLCCVCCASSLCSLALVPSAAASAARCRAAPLCWAPG